jgi:hypothetical protein
MDVNFKVLVNSEDKETLRDTINDFLFELNFNSPYIDYIELSNEPSRIEGIYGINYDFTNMGDKEFDNITKKYLNKDKEDIDNG